MVRPISSVSLESFPSKHGASSQSQRLSRQTRQSLSITRRLQQNESSGLLRSGHLEKEGSFWMALKTSVLSVICHSNTNTPEFRLPGWAALKCPPRTPEPRRHETKMPMLRKLWQPHPNCSQNYVSNLNNSSQSSGQRGPFFHAQAWNSRSPSSCQKVFAARTRDCSAILNVLLSPLCNIKDRLHSNSRMHRGNYAMCNLPTTNKNP